jgi:site-specific recombinase XerD
MPFYHNRVREQECGEMEDNVTTSKAVTTRESSALATAGQFDPIVSLVLDSLTSEHSRRAYGVALDDFLTWWDRQGQPSMSKAVVQRYKRKLQDNDLAPSTINQRLSAIRKLAQEAADNGLVDPHLAASIARVKGVRLGGRRSGNWLTRDQAQELLNAPDTTTLKGLRDQAILAVLLGAGLRRSECADLTFEHVQQREDRWVLVDIVGKRNKVRSVPLPSWVKLAIDEWAEAADISGKREWGRVEPNSSTRVFRSLRKSDKLNGESMTSQAIYDVVRHYADECGFGPSASSGQALAAHDLRRTFAKLAHKGKAGLDQIQLSLGHASIKTTERYLGVEQGLTDAPCDRLGLKIE